MVFYKSEVVYSIAEVKRTPQVHACRKTLDFSGPKQRKMYMTVQCERCCLCCQFNTDKPPVKCPFCGYTGE